MTSFFRPVCDDRRDATSFDWYFSIFLTKSYMWTIPKKSLVIRILSIWKTKGEKMLFFLYRYRSHVRTRPVLSMGVIHMFRLGLRQLAPEYVSWCMFAAPLWWAGAGTPLTWDKREWVPRSPEMSRSGYPAHVRWAAAATPLTWDEREWVPRSPEMSRSGYLAHVRWARARIPLT